MVVLYMALEKITPTLLTACRRAGGRSPPDAFMQEQASKQKHLFQRALESGGPDSSLRGEWTMAQGFCPATTACTRPMLNSKGESNHA